MAGPPMAVVNAGTRDGQGGSPTAVVIDDATLTDDDRHAIARRTGTSHKVGVHDSDDGQAVGAGADEVFADVAARVDEYGPAGGLVGDQARRRGSDGDRDRQPRAHRPQRPTLDIRQPRRTPAVHPPFDPCLSHDRVRHAANSPACFAGRRWRSRQGCAAGSACGVVPPRGSWGGAGARLPPSAASADARSLTWVASCAARD